MEQKKYKVKQGKVIYHGGEEFGEGSELWLVDAVAVVHAANIEEVAPTEGEQAPALPEELPADAPGEIVEAIAILEEVAKPNKNAAK